MTEQEEFKLDRIAYESTKGRALTKEENVWIQALYRKDPTDYRRVQSAASGRAHSEVDPFS